MRGLGGSLALFVSVGGCALEGDLPASDLTGEWSVKAPAIENANLKLVQAADGALTGSYVDPTSGAAVTVEGRLAAQSAILSTSDGRTLGVWVDDHRLIRLQATDEDGDVSTDPFPPRTVRLGRLPTRPAATEYVGEYELSVERGCRPFGYECPLEPELTGAKLTARITAPAAPDIAVLALEVTPPGGGPPWTASFEVLWDRAAYNTNPVHHWTDPKASVDFAASPAVVVAKVGELRLEGTMVRR